MEGVWRCVWKIAHAGVRRSTTTATTGHWDALTGSMVGLRPGFSCSHGGSRLLCWEPRSKLEIPGYTSGSTGTPKGVQIPHRAVINFLNSMQKEPGLSDTDTLLSVTTLSFDIAALELFLPLMVGARLVVVDKEAATDGNRLADSLCSSRATVMQATPSTWRMLIDAGWQGSEYIRILCGGETLPRDLADQLLDRCREVWNLYGPTEATIWSTLCRVERGEGPVSIGHPIDNTHVYLLDRRLQPVPVGIPGTLHIGGDGLARGYLKRPELTAEKFIPSPFPTPGGVEGSDEPAPRLYNTGDLARYREDGQIEFLGRTDHQVKIRGHRIELGEVAASLAKHPKVQDVVVVAREDDPHDIRLVAYIVTDGEEAASVSDLHQYLSRKLSEYMVPSHFVFLDALPLTPNGKVDRRGLPAPGVERPAMDKAFVAPRDAVEMQLSKLWERLLRVRPVGIRDDFFELGGHSMLAVHLVAQVEKVYGKRLPLATLFQAPTVEQLAAILHEKKWSPSWSSLVAIRPGGSNPTFFLMHSHGGNVLEYHPLAHLFGDDQPVYALQARGLDGQIEHDRTMEEMAADYISEMRSLQPDGPYYLGGFCFGGMLALEVAQQLKVQGEEVGLLVLIQTPTKEFLRYPPGTTLVRRVGYRMARRINIELSNLKVLGYRGNLPYLWERAKRLRDIVQARIELMFDPMLKKLPIRNRKRSLAYTLEELVRVHNVAFQQYVPRPYEDAVVLLPASKQRPGIRPDPELGWRGLLNGELSIQVVPGRQQNMLREPHVTILAEKIRACLGEAQAGLRVKIVNWGE